MTRRLYPLLIGAVLVFAAFFYFWTDSDLWLDEALAVNIARLPLGDLREALEHDGAPPLYYAVLHVWTGVLGDGDFASRSLSGLFGVGALVGIWFAGKRLAGTSGAWIAVIVMASSPFAIRYATEARMYILEVFLVTWGILAVLRAVERPSIGRLSLVTLVTALLVYTQYWAFYVVGVVGLVMMLRRQWRIVIAMGIGALAFAPWLPTFMSQRVHTGTPWGDPVLPGLPIGETFLEFGGGEEQEGYLLFLVLIGLLVLGVFGHALDSRRIELDIRGAPEARWTAIVGAATLVVGTSLSYLAGQAFEPRYSAIVFPFFVLLVARGATTLTDPNVQLAVLAVVVVLGFAGGARNVTEQRTQAGEVAAVLRAEAQPGDFVLYCPDQLGPAVHRLGPGGLDQRTYPDQGDPAFVDWVDYQERLDAANPQAFVEAVLADAGETRIWYVTGPGYPNHHGVCEQITDLLSEQRPAVPRVLPDDDIFEKPGLVEFSSPR